MNDHELFEASKDMFDRISFKLDRLGEMHDLKLAMADTSRQVKNSVEVGHE